MNAKHMKSGSGGALNSAQMHVQTAKRTPLIEAKGLCKRYKGFSLEQMTFTVEPGEVVGFIGKNGAGKSTTIKALLGLVVSDEGDARILGMPAQAMVSLRGGTIKEQVGVVFDTVSVPPHMSVAEVGKLMSCAYKTWDQSLFDRLLAWAQLNKTKTVKELSRGMGMKLSLACALAHHPRLLILDEATAGLDPMARDEVLDILREFVAVEDEHGEPVNGILMSSHITSDLDKIADRVLCIDSGRLIFSLLKDEICDQMGVAHMREGEFAQLVSAGTSAWGTNDSQLHYMRRDYGIDVLVNNRFAFAQAHPDIPCDRLDIDGYMAFMLKGETTSVASVYNEPSVRTFEADSSSPCAVASDLPNTPSFKKGDRA